MRYRNHLEEKEEAGLFSEIMNDHYTLVNWVGSLDLLCRADWQIGILEGIAFTGMCLGALLLSGAANYFGKRTVYIFSLVLCALSHLFLYFIPNYSGAVFFLFILGIGILGRLSIGFVLCMDYLAVEY